MKPLASARGPPRRIASQSAAIAQAPSRYGTAAASAHAQPERARVGDARVPLRPLDRGQEREQVRIAGEAVEADDRPAGDPEQRGRGAGDCGAGEAAREEEPGEQRQEEQLECDRDAQGSSAAPGVIAPAPRRRQSEHQRAVHGAVVESRDHGRRQEGRAVDTPVAHADDAQRQRSAPGHQPDPQPRGDGRGQVAEGDADEQRRSRVRDEDAASELSRDDARPRPRRAPARDTPGGTGRRRAGSRARARRNCRGSRPTRRPCPQEAADQDRERHDQRREAEADPFRGPASALQQPVDLQVAARDRGAHTGWIDSREGCPHPPGEGRRGAASGVQAP